MTTNGLRPIGTLSVLLVLLIPAICLGQPSVAGTYKLVSFTMEVDGEPPRDIFGKGASGYLIMTPARLMAILTGEGRKPGPSDADKAGLWSSLIALSGPYRLEGDKLIIAVDISWNETWTRTSQVRRWQLEGNRLTLTTDPAPYARDPSKHASTRVVWERSE